MNCSDWVAKFKADYFDRGGTNTTWRSEYSKVLKWLPQDQELTVQVLHELVRRSIPNTRTRVRYCMVAGKLAGFAGIDYNAKAYRGKYKSDAIRNIPDDRLIVEAWQAINNPGWRWVFGMMAAYGLRNHEVFRLDLSEIDESDHVVEVLRGKTGYRMVLPYHPEWVDRFDLCQVVYPGVDVDRSNEAVGHSVTEYFSDHGLGIRPYDLRHAYAIRTLRYGLDLTIASRMMGHSREVHEKVYRRWIDRLLIQGAYKQSITQGDRPRPPAI